MKLYDAPNVRNIAVVGHGDVAQDDSESSAVGRGLSLEGADGGEGSQVHPVEVESGGSCRGLIGLDHIPPHRAAQEATPYEGERVDHGFARRIGKPMTEAEARVLADRQPGRGL